MQSTTQTATKMMWKIRSDMGSIGQSAAHRTDRQEHQDDEKDDGQNQDGVDELLLREEMHEESGHEEALDRGDRQSHGDGPVLRHMPHFDDTNGHAGQYGKGTED